MNDMIVTLAEPFKPIESFSRLDRFDLRDPSGPAREAVPAEFLPRDWTRVDRAVQDGLRSMADRIRRSHPEIRSRAGRTAGNSFFLYTYRVFDLGDAEELDPIIVGLNFEPVPGSDQVRMRADIGGESTGRIDFEIDPIEVSNELASILAAAYGAVNQLTGQTDLVVKSVLARHAVPTY